MKLRITNTLPEAIRISEFSTAGVRFIVPDSGISPGAGNYPLELVAKTGLRVGPRNTVAPGDTVEVDLDATDAVWETELLIDLTSGAGTSIAGLLFFHDASGKRHMVPVFSPIVPSFA
jgi:methane/ammonia monooxygenase subunit B